MAYVKCVIYMCVAVGFLLFAVPFLYELNPTLRAHAQKQDENDIHAGAIYYSDVPITMDTELANREAVKQGIAARAAKIKNQ
jgi:hypothetical protein